MKNNWKWILLFLSVLVVAFLAAVPFFACSGMLPFGHLSGIPMMGMRFGQFFLRGGHMSGFGMFGGLWMPLLLIGLIVLGVAGWVRKPQQSHNEAAASIPCPHCGKHVQSGWLACPYCGEKIE